MTFVPCVGSGGMLGSCVLSTSGENHLRISPSDGWRLFRGAVEVTTEDPSEANGPFTAATKNLVSTKFSSFLEMFATCSSNFLNVSITTEFVKVFLKLSYFFQTPPNPAITFTRPTLTSISIGNITLV